MLSSWRAPRSGAWRLSPSPRDSAGSRAEAPSSPLGCRARRRGRTPSTAASRRTRPRSSSTRPTRTTSSEPRTTTAWAVFQRDQCVQRRGQALVRPDRPVPVGTEWRDARLRRRPGAHVRQRGHRLLREHRLQPHGRFERHLGQPIDERRLHLEPGLRRNRRLNPPNPTDDIARCGAGARSRTTFTWSCRTTGTALGRTRTRTCSSSSRSTAARAGSGRPA